MASKSGKRRASSSAPRRAKKRSRPATASSPATKGYIYKAVTFEEDTSPVEGIGFIFTGFPVKPPWDSGMKEKSRKARASSSAARRARKAGVRSTKSSPTTRPDTAVFVDETSPGIQEAIIGAPDKPGK